MLMDSTCDPDRNREDIEIDTLHPRTSYGTDDISAKLARTWQKSTI